MSRRIIENPTQCPMTHAVNIIGGKWKPLIIYVLSNGTLRFGQLAFFLPSISRKVLAEQLKELEHDGLIIRKAYPEIPPKVEYSLSDKGEALLPIFAHLCSWSKEKMGEVEFG
ncbi:MAG: helix-turn-helix domain-containing protein [Cyclobacteriaceae bacterium]